MSTWGHFLVAGVLAWILSSEFPLWLTGGWALALCAAVSWQAWFATGLAARNNSSASDVREQLGRFTWSAACVGALWAVAAGLLFPVENADLRWFLLFVIGGMSLAAVGTQHVYLPACYASMTAALPCLAIRYALSGAWLEALLILLYAVVIIRLARMLNRFTAQTVRLQQDRDQLLTELVSRADELEAAREAADFANVAKSRFLAQASHDLRQPLHAIGLFVETIAHDPSPDRVERVVGRVRNSLESLSKLFESLLDVSLLDTGQIKVQQERVALQTLFDRLEREFADRARQAHVDLHFHPTRAAITTDESLLTRLTMNLVSNAIRYSPGGRVLVGTRYRGSGISIEIRDNGVGVSEAEQHRIFEEFVRLENSPAPTDGQGLGLGLAIVSRSARLLDVEVDLHSRANAGSRFRVGVFERDRSRATTAPDPDTPAELTDLLAGAHVLLIDDDIESLDGMTELLQSWRCEVTAHSDPTTVATAEEWDAVISDYELGHQQYGDTLITRLRETTASLPAILISGSTAAEVAERAQKANLPLLRKPVRPAQLRSALLHVLVNKSRGTHQ